VRTLVKVKNIGQGAALRNEAILRNGSGQEGILISAGRSKPRNWPRGLAGRSLSSMRSGRTIAGRVPLDLVVADTVLGESVTDKIQGQAGAAGVSPFGRGTAGHHHAFRGCPAPSADRQCAGRGLCPQGNRVEEHRPHRRLFTGWRSRAVGRRSWLRRRSRRAVRPRQLCSQVAGDPARADRRGTHGVPGNTVHIKATASDDS